MFLLSGFHPVLFTQHRGAHVVTSEWWTWQHCGSEPKEWNNPTFCLFHHISNDHYSLHLHGTFSRCSRFTLWRQYGEARVLPETFAIVEAGHSAFAVGNITPRPHSQTANHLCGHSRTRMWFHQHMCTFGLLRRTNPPGGGRASGERTRPR